MGVLLEYTLKRHSWAWKEGVGEPKGKSMEGHKDGGPKNEAKGERCGVMPPKGMEGEKALPM